MIDTLTYNYKIRKKEVKPCDDSRNKNKHIPTKGANLLPNILKTIFKKHNITVAFRTQQQFL